MIADRLTTVTEIAARLGAGGVLLTDPATVRWLGVDDARDVHVLAGAGEGLLIEAEAENGAAALRHALARAGFEPDDPVAVEAQALPAALADGLDRRRRIDVAAELATARARKSDDEVELITAAAALASIGQGAVRSAVAAGVSEVELWAVSQAELAHARGGPVEANVDLMAGERTAEIDGRPGLGIAAEGDPILFDLAPQRDGYWADSCATLSCGRPSAALARRHSAVRAALDRGLRSARPGMRACQIDAEIRDELRRAGLGCPHHTGHGVGTAPQEPPWITPENETVLEEGMVVALEPGAYSDGLGVRLEHLALIEPGGARALTTHSLNLT